MLSSVFDSVFSQRFIVVTAGAEMKFCSTYTLTGVDVLGCAKYQRLDGALDSLWPALNAYKDTLLKLRCFFFLIKLSYILAIMKQL